MSCMRVRRERASRPRRPPSSSPSKMISPEVGFLNPPRVRASVLFPDPDSPRMPSVSPAQIEKLTPSRALTARDLVTAPEPSGPAAKLGSVVPYALAWGGFLGAAWAREQLPGLKAAPANQALPLLLGGPTLALLMLFMPLAIFLWVVVSKSVQAAAIRPTHDLDDLVGQRGEARTAIKDDGSVYVGGEMWTARSDDVVPSGSRIRVVRREGFILVVEKEKSDR